MLIIGIVVAVQFILLTAYWLWKRYNPQGVLIVSGTLMLILSYLAGLSNPVVANSTGSKFFDIFKIISESFSDNFINGGLMILAIGGYVSYMKQIKANEVLASVTMRPLSLLHKHPYLAATALIPIGQILFMCIPSATGLAFLLAGTILPIFTKMGISKPTTVSAIALCTIFDLGPGSANSMFAAQLSGLNRLHYFVDYQLGYIILLSIILMLSFYFTSKWMDKKENILSVSNADIEYEEIPIKDKPHSIFAILPVLPLILLLVFSSYTGNMFGMSIEIDITLSVFISMFISMLFDFIHSKSINHTFFSLKFFWEGMGRTFTKIITLIVCAEIFAKGLISLGLVDMIADLTTGTGASGQWFGIIMTISIFTIAMITGSGNAAFFSFGPLAPSIASKVGLYPVNMILPMQLSASIGRSMSPIAGVIIAISEIGGVNPFDIVKRNAIPVLTVLISMLIYHSFVIL